MEWSDGKGTKDHWGYTEKSHSCLEEIVDIVYYRVKCAACEPQKEIRKAFLESRIDVLAGIRCTKLELITFNGCMV